MKKIYTLIIASLTLFSLSACGFQPMYGAHSVQSTEGIVQSLGQIEISNIPDREGQYLRNALIDRFYRESRPSSPLYTLQIEPVKETLTDLDITKSSDATRGQLRLRTAMRLIDKKTGETLLERKLTTVTSYNILNNEFSTRVSEDNTRLNALNDLARQIELQVGLYLQRS